MSKIALSYDMHIHSCLSPCGDNDMTPNNIAGMAHIKGLDIIALTDHNSCKNCLATKKICDEYGIIFLPGMEMTTQEEIHVLCYFDEVEKALLWDEYVSSRLIPVKNEPQIFGEQLILDENDEKIGEVENLLINATTIDFDEVFPAVKKFGGVALPAHIDKKSNSLLSQLGFIPENSDFFCYEVAKKDNLQKHILQHKFLENLKFYTSSDAHYLQDINEPLNFLHADEKSAKAVFKSIETRKLNG